MPDAVPVLSIEEHMSTVTVVEKPMKPQPEDFREMFEEHYDLIYRTAYSITRKSEDAEDVVQAVFLYLFGSQRPPDLTKNPKGVLLQIRRESLVENGSLTGAVYADGQQRTT
jgi:hypothetical protein